MKKYTYLILLLFWGAFASAQGKVSIVDGYGDLYILHQADKKIRIVAAKADGEVLDTTLSSSPKNLKLRYHTLGTEQKVSFDFHLHPRIKHSWRQEKPHKTLVISDLHGHFDAFIAVLKGNGVVDANLNWSYGTNQLLFLGDALDRGRDDNGILWFLYKLEEEAEKAGGHLDFILGNHEDMVLKDDIRYVHQDHLIFTAKAGIPYSQLYGTDTELGRWVRDSYLVLIENDNLFVHAGLSPIIAKKNYKIGEINELGWRFAGYPNKSRESLHTRNELLFGSDGPLWYRGLVRIAKDSISTENLNEILEYYNVKRIVVGHSEVDEIDYLHAGRVIAVNVRHYKNLNEDKTAGLLIEGDKLYSVTYSGKKVLLNISE